MSLLVEATTVQLKRATKLLILFRLTTIQSTLVILNSNGLSGILRDIRTSTYQICGKNNSNTHIQQIYMYWTLEVDIAKILWKRGAISPLFHNIFHLLLAFHD